MLVVLQLHVVVVVSLFWQLLVYSLFSLSVALHTYILLNGSLHKSIINRLNRYQINRVHPFL